MDLRLQFTCQSGQQNPRTCLQLSSLEKELCVPCTILAIRQSKLDSLPTLDTWLTAASCAFQRLSVKDWDAFTEEAVAITDALIVTTASKLEDLGMRHDRTNVAPCSSIILECCLALVAEARARAMGSWISYACELQTTMTRIYNQALAVASRDPRNYASDDTLSTANVGRQPLARALCLLVALAGQRVCVQSNPPLSMALCVPTGSDQHRGVDVDMGEGEAAVAHVLGAWVWESDGKDVVGRGGGAREQGQTCTLGLCKLARDERFLLSLAAAEVGAALLAAEGAQDATTALPSSVTAMGLCLLEGSVARHALQVANAALEAAARTASSRGHTEEAAWTRAVATAAVRAMVGVRASVGPVFLLGHDSSAHLEGLSGHKHSVMHELSQTLPVCNGHECHPLPLMRAYTPALADDMLGTLLLLLPPTAAALEAVFTANLAETDTMGSSSLAHASGTPHTPAGGMGAVWTRFAAWAMSEALADLLQLAEATQTPWPLWLRYTSLCTQLDATGVPQGSLLPPPRCLSPALLWCTDTSQRPHLDGSRGPLVDLAHASEDSSAASSVLSLVQRVVVSGHATVLQPAGATVPGSVLALALASGRASRAQRSAAVARVLAEVSEDVCAQVGMAAIDAATICAVADVGADGWVLEAQLRVWQLAQQLACIPSERWFAVVARAAGWWSKESPAAKAGAGGDAHTEQVAVVARQRGQLCGGVARFALVLAATVADISCIMVAAQRDCILALALVRTGRLDADDNRVPTENTATAPAGTARMWGALQAAATQAMMKDKDRATACVAVTPVDAPLNRADARALAMLWGRVVVQGSHALFTVLLSACRQHVGLSSPARPTRLIAPPRLLNSMAISTLGLLALVSPSAANHLHTAIAACRPGSGMLADQHPSSSSLCTDATAPYSDNLLEAMPPTPAPVINCADKIARRLLRVLHVCGAAAFFTTVADGARARLGCGGGNCLCCAAHPSVSWALQALLEAQCLFWSLDGPSVCNLSKLGSAVWDAHVALAQLRVSAIARAAAGELREIASSPPSARAAVDAIANDVCLRAYCAATASVTAARRLLLAHGEYSDNCLCPYRHVIQRPAGHGTVPLSIACGVPTQWLSHLLLTATGAAIEVAGTPRARGAVSATEELMARSATTVAELRAGRQLMANVPSSTRSGVWRGCAFMMRAADMCVFAGEAVAEAAMAAVDTAQKDKGALAGEEALMMDIEAEKVASSEEAVVAEEGCCLLLNCAPSVSGISTKPLSPALETLGITVFPTVRVQPQQPLIALVVSVLATLGANSVDVEASGGQGVHTATLHRPAPSTTTTLAAQGLPLAITAAWLVAQWAAEITAWRFVLRNAAWCLAPQGWHTASVECLSTLMHDLASALPLFVAEGMAVLTPAQNKGRDPFSEPLDLTAAACITAYAQLRAAALTVSLLVLTRAERESQANTVTSLEIVWGTGAAQSYTLHLMRSVAMGPCLCASTPGAIVQLSAGEAPPTLVPPGSPPAISEKPASSLAALLICALEQRCAIGSTQMVSPTEAQQRGPGDAANEMFAASITATPTPCGGVIQACSWQDTDVCALALGLLQLCPDEVVAGVRPVPASQRLLEHPLSWLAQTRNILAEDQARAALHTACMTGTYRQTVQAELSKLLHGPNHDAQIAEAWDVAVAGAALGAPSRPAPRLTVVHLHSAALEAVEALLALAAAPLSAVNAMHNITEDAAAALPTDKERKASEALCAESWWDEKAACDCMPVDERVRLGPGDWYGVLTAIVGTAATTALALRRTPTAASLAATSVALARLLGADVANLRTLTPTASVGLMPWWSVLLHADWSQTGMAATMDTAAILRGVGSLAVDSRTTALCLASLPRVGLPIPPSMHLAACAQTLAVLTRLVYVACERVWSAQQQWGAGAGIAPLSLPSVLAAAPLLFSHPFPILAQPLAVTHTTSEPRLAALPTLVHFLPRPRDSPPPPTLAPHVALALAVSARVIPVLLDCLHAGYAADVARGASQELVMAAGGNRAPVSDLAHARAQRLRWPVLSELVSLMIAARGSEQVVGAHLQAAVLAHMLNVAHNGRSEEPGQSLLPGDSHTLVEATPSLEGREPAWVLAEEYLGAALCAVLTAQAKPAWVACMSMVIDGPGASISSFPAETCAMVAILESRAWAWFWRYASRSHLADISSLGEADLDVPTNAVPGQHALGACMQWLWAEVWLACAGPTPTAAAVTEEWSNADTGSTPVESTRAVQWRRAVRVLQGLVDGRVEWQDSVFEPAARATFGLQLLLRGVTRDGNVREDSQRSVAGQSVAEISWQMRECVCATLLSVVCEWCVEGTAMVGAARTPGAAHGEDEWAGESDGETALGTLLARVTARVGSVLVACSLLGEAAQPGASDGVLTYTATGAALNPVACMAVVERVCVFIDTVEAWLSSCDTWDRNKHQESTGSLSARVMAPALLTLRGAAVTLATIMTASTILAPPLPLYAQQPPTALADDVLLQSAVTAVEEQFTRQKDVLSAEAVATTESITRGLATQDAANGHSYFEARESTTAMISTAEVATWVCTPAEAVGAGSVVSPRAATSGQADVAAHTRNSGTQLLPRYPHTMLNSLPFPGMVAATAVGTSTSVTTATATAASGVRSPTEAIEAVDADDAVKRARMALSAATEATPAHVATRMSLLPPTELQAGGRAGVGTALNWPPPAHTVSNTASGDAESQNVAIGAALAHAAAVDAHAMEGPEPLWLTVGAVAGLNTGERLRVAAAPFVCPIALAVHQRRVAAETALAAMAHGLRVITLGPQTHSHGLIFPLRLLAAGANLLATLATAETAQRTLPQREQVVSGPRGITQTILAREVLRDALWATFCQARAAAPASAPDTGTELTAFLHDDDEAAFRGAMDDATFLAARGAEWALPTSRHQQHPYRSSRALCISKLNLAAHTYMARARTALIRLCSALAAVGDRHFIVGGRLLYEALQESDRGGAVATGTDFEEDEMRADLRMATFEAAVSAWEHVVVVLNLSPGEARTEALHMATDTLAATDDRADGHTSVLRLLPLDEESCTCENPWKSVTEIPPQRCPLHHPLPGVLSLTGEMLHALSAALVRMALPALPRFDAGASANKSKPTEATNAYALVLPVAPRLLAATTLTWTAITARLAALMRAHRCYRANTRAHGDAWDTNLVLTCGRLSASVWTSKMALSTLLASGELLVGVDAEDERRASAGGKTRRESAFASVHRGESPGAHTGKREEVSAPTMIISSREERVQSAAAMLVSGCLRSAEVVAALLARLCIMEMLARGGGNATVEKHGGAGTTALAESLLTRAECVRIAGEWVAWGPHASRAVAVLFSLLCAPWLGQGLASRVLGGYFDAVEGLLFEGKAGEYEGGGTDGAEVHLPRAANNERCASDTTATQEGKSTTSAAHRDIKRDWRVFAPSGPLSGDDYGALGGWVGVGPPTQKHGGRVRVLLPSIHCMTLYWAATELLERVCAWSEVCVRMALRASATESNPRTSTPDQQSHVDLKTYNRSLPQSAECLVVTGAALVARGCGQLCARAAPAHGQVVVGTAKTQVWPLMSEQGSSVEGSTAPRALSDDSDVCLPGSAQELEEEASVVGEEGRGTAGLETTIVPGTPQWRVDDAAMDAWEDASMEAHTRVADGHSGVARKRGAVRPRSSTGSSTASTTHADAGDVHPSGPSAPGHGRRHAVEKRRKVNSVSDVSMITMATHSAFSSQSDLLDDENVQENQPQVRDSATKMGIHTGAKKQDGYAARPHTETLSTAQQADAIPERDSQLPALSPGAFVLVARSLGLVDLVLTFTYSVKQQFRAGARAIAPVRCGAACVCVGPVPVSVEKLRERAGRVRARLLHLLRHRAVLPGGERTRTERQDAAATTARGGDSGGER